MRKSSKDLSDTRDTEKALPDVVNSIVPLTDGDVPIASTLVEYSGLQTAFDFLNATLFDGQLPDVFIVYSRRAHSGGHYAPRRYSGRNGSLDRDELSLNPDGFVGQTDEFIVAILLHEMDHHWQEHFDTAKKRKNYAYHDREWAAKMESQGLMPSNTGMVGGKRTGQRMSHFIVSGGPYQQAFAALAATGWKLNLQSTIRAGADKKKSNKATYDCLACAEVSAWGKPKLGLVCKDCLLASISHVFGSDNATATALIEMIDGVTMLERKSDPADAASPDHPAAVE